MQRICLSRKPRFITLLAVSSMALLTLVAACGQDGPSAEAQNLLLQGARHRLNGEPLRAIAAYTDAIGDSPKFGEAYLERADTLSELRRRSEAQRDYARALELDESLASTVYVNRGVMHLGAEDYSLAIRDFDRALELDPDDPTTLGNRGLARAQAGDLAGGLLDLDASISISTTNSVTYATRALIRAVSGQHAGSIQDYDRAIQLRPYDSDLLFQRSLVLIESGSLQRALEDLDQAISVAPERARLYVMRSRVRRDLGQVAGADSDATKAESLGVGPDTILSLEQSSLLPAP